jgi:hypothetical protein
MGDCSEVVVDMLVVTEVRQFIHRLYTVPVTPTVGLP